MNKAGLKAFVAETAGITKKEANIVINSVLEGIEKGILEDQKVTLVGFGTFTTAVRKARKARNPQTGESIDVPTKLVPKFKPSAALKTAVLELGVEKPEETPAPAAPEASAPAAPEATAPAAPEVAEAAAPEAGSSDFADLADAIMDTDAKSEAPSDEG